jgi:hypothetical protein
VDVAERLIEYCAATRAEGHQHTTLTEFPEDRTAIGDARYVVTAEHLSVAVARVAGAEIEFLGAWVWSDGQARWTAEE